MEDKTTNYVYDSVFVTNEVDASRKYLANVFIWMFVALGISAVCAYIFANDIDLLNLIINTTTGGFTTLGMVVVFSPLAFSLVINFGFSRISYPVMVLLFLAYAVVIGMSLSVILLIYTASSIFSVFITASLLFGVMAVAGYYTTQDLTKFGSILYMFFIGIIIASIVNFFFASETVSYIIAYIGVAVFVGLTAYYIQMLKRIGAGIEYGDAASKKLVIIGAFTLYTTFINLFLSLLRIFGRRN
ncbi:MAG: Bax inhibitor-1/YccA family protein [Mucilaginibacter sp.]